MARQRLGQHFLHDAGWREKIARAIHVSPHSLSAAPPSAPYCWVEIGAGHGEMTEYLAATGAPVCAVELDPPLIAGLQKLRKRFLNLQVVSGDVLKTDFAAIAKQAAGCRLRLYGNLPYYITSPILHHFFRSAELIDEIHIVIQWEVAERLAAEPGTRDYGYLSVLTQYFSRPTVALKIPPGAFRPPPEVDSALVSLRLPGAKAQLKLKDDAAFLEFVKRCFAHKRKTLVNNLREAAKPEQVKRTLQELELGTAARAEELSVQQLSVLFTRLDPA